MKKLIIDNIVADLPEEVVVALTKQSNELFDLKNKRSNLSNTIVLPYTKTNHTIFKHIYDPATADITHKQWHLVTYVQDFEEIVQYGRGRLMSAKDGYHFIVYWGNVDLTAILGDKSIKDLNLDDLNHDWNLVNVKTEETVTDTDDSIIYPVIKTTETMPVGDSDSPIDARTQPPFVSVARLLRQIETDNNITLTGAIREFMDMPEQGFIETDCWIPVQLKNTADIEDYEDSNPEVEKYQPLPSLPAIWQPTPEQIIEATTYDVLGYPNVQTFFTDYFQIFDEFTASEDLDLQVELMQYIIELTQYSKIIAMNQVTIATKIEKYTGGVWVEIEQFGNPYGNIFQAIGPGPEYSTNKILNTGIVNFNVQLDAGEKIRAKIEVTRIITPHSDPLTIDFITLLHDGYLKITAGDLQFGNTYRIAETLPDIKQIDLIKYFVAKENLMLNTESGSNVFEFLKFDSVVNSEAQDYSEKISDWEIDELQPDVAQENIMRYDNDDNIEANLGQGKIIITNQTLPVSQEIYVAPFSASKNIEWNDTPLGEMLIAPEDLSEQWENVGARIFKLYNYDNQLHYTTGLIDSSTSSKYIAIFSQGLNFQIIANTKYVKWREIINKFKAFNLKANISVTDFNTIDVMRLLYIKQLGGHFIIRKVQDFVQGKTTTIKALKL